MKTLYLVRHAKAIEHSFTIDDFYRSLNERGIINAHAMAEKIGKQKVVPEYMLSSPATRALTTAVIFAKTLGFPLNKIDLCEGLYEASVEVYFDIINRIPKNTNTLFLVAHNPTLTDFADVVIGGSMINNHVPTSGVVGISVKSWERADLMAGGLLLFDHPNKTK